MKRTRIGLVLLLLAAGAVPAAAADKSAAAPTFSKDVAPILFQQCAGCHRPGEAAPFSLLTYDDARKRGKLIAQLTHSRQMPPWKADPGDVPFRNERRLKDEQIAVLRHWVEAGMPEGDRALLPAAPTFAGGWALGKPDLVVKMPKAYQVAAEGRDDYRNFAIPLGLTEDKWVKAIDFRPSARSVVHHTLFLLDATGESSKREKASGEVGSKGGMGALRGGAGRTGGLGGGLSGQGGALTGSVGSLGGWAVGAQPHMLPKDLAYHVPKGSDLILSTHFHPSGKAEEEASTVALYFTDKPPAQRFTGLQLPFGFGIAAGIDIRAGTKDFAIQDSFVLPVDVKAFGVAAHAHYIAKEFKLTATLPDGKTKTLLGISDWDFAWQDQYQFQEFEYLPKGTKLSVKITYDNSADNPRNPSSPPKRVRWGRESLDEMGSVTLQVVAAREDEFAKLQDGYRQHVRDSLARGNGALKKLMEKK
jgi:mono/diheme cytochrome c family protein